MAVETLEQTRTTGTSPQTTGRGERFPKTLLNECSRIPFRKKRYTTVADRQSELDRGLPEYKEARGHQGRWGYGRTPRQTFVDPMPLATETLLAA